MVTEPHSTPSAPPPEAPSGPRGFWRDLGIAHIGNGLAGFFFAASGPLDRKSTRLNSSHRL